MQFFIFANYFLVLKKIKNIHPDWDLILYLTFIFGHLIAEKSLRHRVFPGGPPSKYYPGPTMLNFRDQTRTGVFIVVWS